MSSVEPLCNSRTRHPSRPSLPGLTAPLILPFDWSEKTPAVATLLAQIQGDNTVYAESVRKYLGSLLPSSDLAVYTPKGLLFMANWGSLPSALSVAFLASVYADSGTCLICCCWFAYNSFRTLGSCVCVWGGGV